MALPGHFGPGPAATASGWIGLPVDLAKVISDEIVLTGTVTHAYFGVQTLPIPPVAAVLVRSAR